MSNRKEFFINLDLFKKRLTLRTASIFIINLLLLGWTIWTAPKESQLNYLAICSILLTAIGLFLLQSYKKQVLILKNNYLGVNSNILQWYTGNGLCTTINLRRVRNIERDKYRGFDRFMIYEGDTPHTILNLKDSDEFQKELESVTSVKVQVFDFDWKNKILKAIGFFFPAMVSLVFTYLKYLDIRFFFLIITVNSIFFLVQFSEKRTRSGFSESTVRRSTIILIFVLAYQILILINE